MNTSYFERIAGEWRERAEELAAWTMQHVVNRQDVWGRYIVKKTRTQGGELRNSAITAPLRDQRGKVFLEQSSLAKHYRARDTKGILGVHSISADGGCRWLAIDIDLHDPLDPALSPEANFSAAHAWWERLNEAGFDPLLLDSNGLGGYHLWVLFAEPMAYRSVHQFLDQFTADFEARGLDAAPDLFPGSTERNHYGNWLRLPGRHHTRPHYTRVWNDEPWAEEPWLQGHDAIDRLLRTRLASRQQCALAGVEHLRKTICLDFDGVIHSYTSGWCGETVIPDPPIHGAREAIQRLREHFRVVVHSARTASDAGCEAVRIWLDKHQIPVDEVCRFKPPASVYLDDRGIRFTGDWNQAVIDIHNFRR